MCDFHTACTVSRYFLRQGVFSSLCGKAAFFCLKALFHRNEDGCPLSAAALKIRLSLPARTAALPRPCVFHTRHLYSIMLKLRKMKILVGLSGGVDSAVAAKLLAGMGHDVTGVTLKLIPEDCGTAKNQNGDIRDAKLIADKLGIPHIVYDFRKEFKASVIDYFVETYKCGKTPNPCFICNPKIKFGLLLDRALNEGFEAVATGHYAGIEEDGEKNKILLCRGADRLKDQSYFLGLLNRQQLKHVLFPLYKMNKAEVKEIAASSNIIINGRGESQDICFVPEGDYTRVINFLSPAGSFYEGDFLDCSGKVVGRHKGLQYYTIGQRRGLALALGYPVYVVSKDAGNNTVTVGGREKLLTSSFTVENVNLIACEQITSPIKVTVKTRYRQEEKPAVLIPIGNGKIKADFETPEAAVAEGQAAVFYSGNYVIGAGIIADTERVKQEKADG